MKTKYPVSSTWISISAVSGLSQMLIKQVGKTPIQVIVSSTKPTADARGLVMGINKTFKAGNHSNQVWISTMKGVSTVEVDIVSLGVPYTEIDPDITNDQVTATTPGEAVDTPAGASKLLDGIKAIISNGYGWSTLPSITPFPRNRAGIIKAINAIRGIAKAGIIQYEDAVYDISDMSAGELILYKGISHVGVKPLFNYTNHVPDSGFVLYGGTIFDGGTTGNGFVLNNTDQASSTTAIAASGGNLARTAGAFATNGAGCAIYRNMAFRRCKRAFDTGAVNNIGLLYCDVEWLVAEDCVDDWSFKFHNFQHCNFRYIFSKTNLATGGGIDFSASCDSALLPGNSTIDEVYCYSTSQQTRGLRFGAVGGSGCQLNEVRANRCQVNRYGGSTARAITATTTNGSADISAPAADIAWLRVGMTIVFTGATPNWLVVGGTYFVSYVDTATNIFRISNDPLNTGGVVVSASGTYAMASGGFPSLEFVGNGNSLITASTFESMDVECTGSSSPIVIKRIRGTNIRVLESFGGAVGKSCVIRDAAGELVYHSLSNHTFDLDASSTLRPKQLGAGNRLISVAETVAGGRNGSTLVSTSATAITFTIKKDLPRGFGCRFVQGAAGQITIAGEAGVTITNATGLKSSGVGATLELIEISANTYILTGDVVA